MKYLIAMTMLLFTSPAYAVMAGHEMSSSQPGSESKEVDTRFEYNYGTSKGIASEEHDEIQSRPTPEEAKAERERKKNEQYDDWR